MAGEDRLAIGAVERGHDRSDEIADVDHRVRGTRPSDERQHAVRRELKQRKHRAITGAVHDAGPQDNPAQVGHRREHAFAFELAAAVRRHGCGRIIFRSRTAG